MTQKNQSPSDIAEDVYRRVFRTDFSQPGFALIDLGPNCGSEAQRQLMIDLKNELDGLERRYRGRELVYQSLTRFDQQVTTKPHRDGGPDESILMLGYEPSLIESRLEMSDYSKCAQDLGMTPAEFLDRFNPMFSDGRDLLAKFATPFADFDNTSFQIMLINNSMNQFGDGLVGVLRCRSGTLNPLTNLLQSTRSLILISNLRMAGKSLCLSSRRFPARILCCLQRYQTGLRLPRVAKYMG